MWAHALVVALDRRLSRRVRAGRRSSRRPPGASTPRSSGWARSIPWRQARPSRCSAGRSRSSSTPRAIASAGSARACSSAPPRSALGVELDRVWVCGLAEGVFPAPPRDDPLLSDSDRGALDGELPLKRDRIADDQRSLLATLESTTGARTLCFPRWRPASQHRARAFALPPRHGRGARRSAHARRARGGALVHRGAVVPARAHQRAVPRDPARARRARRAGRRRVDRGRARGCPGNRAGARSSEPGVHALRRQPLACRCGAHREEPVVARDRDFGNPPRDLGEVPARVLRARTCCTCGRSSGPRSSSSFRHSTRATSCTRRSTRS